MHQLTDVSSRYTLNKNNGKRKKKNDDFFSENDDFGNGLPQSKQDNTMKTHESSQPC